ncbi:3'-5' exonuclease [Fluviibacter phosphoraccumulans]|uniref:DNA-directed DNA polymerase n=1 Tax=Fluviibacter phosphoraccumulans TaxID=1751046 RepID=A0A679HRI5_9RHOO|nr:exonuclease domain-containing protein [Fluviibacter phosphoraccumulans]BBU68910.1 DNA polymerase III subunit epsilon [Fluviibacter phosphoraccumulans]BBU71939.1 DNA polymerase III subunit epsilon [Fluviibacter phosphoraccumulans]BCA64816.1 DNA polymerase III subunit epsilon [Fluviibacter phosphoraccumulans]
MFLRDLTAKWRFVLAVGVLGLLMTGPFLLTSLLIWLGASPGMREVLVEHLLPQVPLGGMLTATGFVLGLVLIRRLFNRYVTGMAAMVEELRLMLGSNRSFRITEEGPPELRELVRAINDLATQRDAYIDDVESQVAKAKANVEEEKNRLAALMSELAQAVVVSNLDGRILLYNNRARFMFESLAKGPTSVSSGALIGLGRSITSILETSQVDYARETIRIQLERGNRHPVANFVTTTDNGQLIRVQIAPVLRHRSEASAQQVASGYILLIENITRVLEQESLRDEVLGELTEGSRASLGTLRAAVEMLADHPDMGAEDRDRFVGVLASEVTRMSQRLDDTLTSLSDTLRQHWPLDDMLAADVIEAAGRRIHERLKLPVDVNTMTEVPLWIRADSFSLVSALTFLATRIEEAGEVRSFALKLDSDDRFVHIDLVWTGLSMSTETVLTWEIEPMRQDHGVNPPTLREVLDRHAGEIWYQRQRTTTQASIRLLLPRATPEQDASSLAARNESADRPEYYDFDLFDRPMGQVDLDQPLSELVYTVFDTETTGLEPANGDEIIQIGALRIVNGRLLHQEHFDQLVDPRCHLKAASIAIHGITDSMLLGQPTIDLVLPAFHDFCADTVLVGHNVAFDMRFLELKEATLGVRFDQPVLDTLLLSAVAHPNQQSHSLEAIMQRLGIQMEQRHNALADATATAQVFMRILPALAEQGVVTLRQALAASQKTYFAQVKY